MGQLGIKTRVKSESEEKSEIKNKTERKNVNSIKHAAQPAGGRDAATQVNLNLNKSRYISKAILGNLKQRDQHRCRYKDSRAHKQCEANFYLQVEHKVPFAKNGTNDLGNLELLCANHNRLRAVQQFGNKKMKNYLPSLK